MLTCAQFVRMYDHGTKADLFNQVALRVLMAVLRQGRGRLGKSSTPSLCDTFTLSSVGSCGP